MKNLIVMFAVGLLAQQHIHAQGTVYLSNLSQISTGSLSVGSDSWLAADFHTGNNVGGYVLNSIQLAMTDSVGNPSGFTAMIYTDANAGGYLPGHSLGTLSGSSDPSASGIYTYTAPSNLTLLPGNDYFIVLTAGTMVANGAYEWGSLMSPNFYNPSGGWKGEPNSFFTSSDGLSWNFISGTYGQYAITATPVPEPSPSFLLLLGSGVFIYVRRAFRH
jgi:hypothetical protein